MLGEKLRLVNQVIKDFFRDNPKERIVLARELMPQFVRAGIFDFDFLNGFSLMEMLRDLEARQVLHVIPYAVPDRKSGHTEWYFSPPMHINEFLNDTSTPDDRLNLACSRWRDPKSDTNYMLDLCDMVLNKEAKRHFYFDFLYNEAGITLPVDGYYESLNLVIEYRECYDYDDAYVNDPPGMKISPLPDDERAIHNRQKKELLSIHGIKLVEVWYAFFTFDDKGKLIRKTLEDLQMMIELFKLLKVT